MTDWQPFQAGAPPLERAVQARYWTLAKHARPAVCEGLAHPLGTEVTVSVNAGLIRGEVARTPNQARTLASQWAAAFIDKGWGQAGLTGQDHDATFLQPRNVRQDRRPGVNTRPRANNIRPRGDYYRVHRGYARPWLSGGCPMLRHWTPCAGINAGRLAAMGGCRTRALRVPLAPLLARRRPVTLDFSHVGRPTP